MGREVKRVPTDFKWPLHQIWKGYWHPFSSLQCKACDGSGLNPEYKKLSKAMAINYGKPPQKVAR